MAGVLWSTAEGIIRSSLYGGGGPVWHAGKREGERGARTRRAPVEHMCVLRDTRWCVLRDTRCAGSGTHGVQAPEHGARARNTVCGRSRA
eukprot:1545964-Rhodomonas_salina.1